MLSFMESGAQTDRSRPVVILHGLFGSSRNWTTIAKRLAESRHVVAVDLRNHGSSPWADSMTYADMVEDLRALLQARGLAPAAVVGHSMGGKAAMLLALTHPDLVERLAVIDIAPVHYAQVFGAYAAAMMAVDFDRVTRRAEVDAALAAAVPEAGVRAFLMQNLVTEDGRLRWRVNLPVIAAHMGDISGFPELPDEAEFNGPALFLAGGRSDYIRPEHQPLISRLFPQARFAAIPGAGHWPHAEQPDLFTRELSAFLTV